MSTSGFDYVSSIKRKIEATNMLKDCFHKYGVPSIVFSDNTKEILTKEIVSYLIILIVERYYREVPRSESGSVVAL